MVDNLLTVVLVGLAASYAIRAWLHGSIFAEVRSWIEDGQLMRFLPEWLAVKLQMLLGCFLCLAPWTALILLVLLQGSAFFEFAAVVRVLASAAIAIIVYPIMERLG